jgi:Ca2+/H+ antiporter
MAVLGLMFPAVLHFTHSEAHYGKSEVSLSRFSSCIMLVAYASYLFFQLKSQRSLYSPIGEVSSWNLIYATIFLDKENYLCKHLKACIRG